MWVNPWVLNDAVKAWMCHSNAKCIFNFHILCLVYTVQPLHNFITFTIMSTLGRRALKGYLIACATQILHTTRSRSPHNAPHSPSYLFIYFFGRTFDLVSGWQRICACAVPHPLCTLTFEKGVLNMIE